MKYFIRIGICLWCLCCSLDLLHAQTNAIDAYIGTSGIPTIIGSTADQLLTPQDLDFSPVPSRKNELWVVNYGNTSVGGNVVIFYNAGKSTQYSEYRHDSHAGHFMPLPSAIAMGDVDSGYFATSQEVLNSNGDNTSTFMGPVLWDSDTSKFARINQNNWVNGQPLGSHLDMLHQSPYSMGIAYDTLNSYWVFDGYHNCLYHYDFKSTHGYGGDDHDNGEVLRYKEVKLKRIANLPSHMVVDKSSGWLYIVDNGNKRVLRVATKSGKLGSNLIAPNETLDLYREMTGVKIETVDSGFTNLSGIDQAFGRLIVGNFGTGEIRVYNTTTTKPTYMGSILTKDAGMMGLKIGPDSNIWYVNRTNSTVVRLAPGPTPSLVDLISPADSSLAIALPTVLTWKAANGATSYHVQVALSTNFTSTVVDSVGITSLTATMSSLLDSKTYFWRVAAKNTEGQGQWSKVWRFTTAGKVAPKVTLISPKDADTAIITKPTFVWDTLSGWTSYHLQVSLAPTFGTTIIDEKDVPQTKYVVSLPLAEVTRYYWRVSAVNDGAEDQWSDTWSFTTFSTASVNEDAIVNSKISIDEVYPNPSSTYSTVNFRLSEPLTLRVSVVSVTGEEISVLANGFHDVGKHSLTLHSSELASGVYFYKFALPQGVVMKQFVVRK